MPSLFSFLKTWIVVNLLSGRGTMGRLLWWACFQGISLVIWANIPFYKDSDDFINVFCVFRRGGWFSGKLAVFRKRLDAFYSRVVVDGWRRCKKKDHSEYWTNEQTFWWNLAIMAMATLCLLLINWMWPGVL